MILAGDVLRRGGSYGSERKWRKEAVFVEEYP
jgi:hypothetical protein